MGDCLTCKLLADRDTGRPPPWDNIYRTQYWDVVHSYNTSLLGWTVLVARRHVEALADLSPKESVELGPLIASTSRALHELTGCIKTYVLQFAEAAEHPHVHFHVVPRTGGQPDDRRGPLILGYLGVPENERVPEEAMNDLALKMRAALASRWPL